MRHRDTICLWNGSRGEPDNRLHTHPFAALRRCRWFPCRRRRSSRGRRPELRQRRSGCSEPELRSTTFARMSTLGRQVTPWSRETATLARASRCHQPSMPTGLGVRRPRDKANRPSGTIVMEGVPRQRRTERTELPRPCVVVTGTPRDVDATRSVFVDANCLPGTVL